MSSAARDQSGGAVPQPGDARAGPVFAAHVPPQLGPDVPPAEHLRALHGPRLSHARRFIRELKARDYDIVGISSIIVNVGKVREMCRLMRLHSPRWTIVVGGHVTAIPGIEQMIDADHIVRGEGVAWLRGISATTRAPDRAPADPVLVRLPAHGVPGPRGGGNASATIMPSVGCPMGCNFCTTSAFFGGKGKFVNFYHRGEELSASCARRNASSASRRSS